MTLDLRLAPAVVAAWAAAWWLVGRPGVPPTLVVTAGAVGAIALAAAWWRRASAAAHLCLVLACVAAVTLSVHAQGSARSPVAALADDGATAVLTGRVATEPEPSPFGHGVRWVLAVDAVEARGVRTAASAHVEVTAPAPGPRYGAAVRVTARLRPGEAGAAEVARASADRPERELRPPPAVLAATHVLRTGLLDVTEDLTPQARGLVPGAAIGDTSRLPPDLDEAMRVTGLTHITAVSGGHFAVVVAALTGLCAALLIPRVGRVLLLAAASVAFVLLVRPEPSVLRAAWTCAVALLGLALGRPATGFPALAAASIALLVVDPWLARSYGFALSCAATAGLVLLAGPLRRRLEPWTGRPAALALAVPIAAQAACGPVLVLLDPSVPTTSVLANLLAAPALVPATVLGLAATLLAPWAPPVAHVLAWLAGLATGWIAIIARWCASLPLATVPWPGGVGGAALLAALTAAAFAVVLRTTAEGWPRAWREAGPRALRDARRALRRRGLRPRAVALVASVGVGCVAVAVAVPRLAPAAGGTPSDWDVVACDVGQGDALAVRTGPTSAIVIDAGPPGHAAGRCLDRLGVERIDLLVLSHFHADHVGGLDDVVDGREVTAALVSPLDQPSDQASRARRLLAEAGVPVQAAAADLAGTAGDVSWRVLAARATQGGGPAGEEGGDGANDASVVVALHTGDGLDLVALGDLEEAGQEALLADLRDAGFGADVDVVKLAHHGSRSQSEGLAELLHPRVTLVSVGADNTYGHPTDRALDLYAGLGSAIVRTDECGTSVLVVRSGSVGLSCG